jgi:hydroxyacylglutathione hydrolase
MFLKQYYLGCLAHASYLVADEGSGTAIVVDPQRDIGQYLRDAEQLGVELAGGIAAWEAAHFPVVAAATA